MKTKALVVLSGGQDSTTCLFWAKQHFDEVHAVTFNYGQRHALEIDAALKVGTMAGVDSHEIVQVPEVLGGKSFLTDKTAEVERFNSFDEMEHHNAFKDNKLDSSFVPMRNALFLTIAANRAYVHDCQSLITGVTAADFAEFGEFSWEWLGGFIDAEGYFGPANKDSFHLDISQNDPDLLGRLLRWLQKYDTSVSGSIWTDKTGSSTLRLYKTSLVKFIDKVSPHLHYSHRRLQAGKFMTLQQEVELSDAYCTGFWEGDGACWSSWEKFKSKTTKGLTRHFSFSWYQKDPEILKRIQKHFGRGYVGPHGDVFIFQMTDGPLSAKILNRMRPHLNVLGSFRKITKYRHKIELEAKFFNPPYPDCTPDFIMRTEQMINQAIQQRNEIYLKVEAPLMFLSKSQSVRLAKALPGCWDALAYSHTCYSGEFPACGTCHACVLRADGFAKAGEKDPLIERGNYVR